MARDSRWLIILVIILLVVIATCIMNIEHDPNIAARLDAALDIDDGDLGIDWSHYQTTDVELSSSLELTKSEVYHLTGTLYDGNLSIKPDQNATIKLILDNATIESQDGPAITCYDGDDLVIELIGDNYISDGSDYASDYDEDATGAIYSKADLTFTGDGSLTLAANHADGIVSKDDLTFRSGTYHISSADDAIRGKDSVRIAGGNFTIDSVADAIKSTNDTDQGKGFILIEGGNFNLTAGDKGFQTTKSILIHDGNFAINTNDDSVHSDNYISIAGGTFNIGAGDDAIHANRELTISGGDIVIAKSYEGIEAQKITIADGNINVKSTDDGINAGGGADQSATNRPGQKDPFAADENCILSINGGSLYINASGDGIDSNGWLYINGGTTIVDGPTNDGNGALDAGLGIIANGGELIALGSSGMAEAPSQASAINSIGAYLNQTYLAGTNIEIRNQNGDTIISYTSAKTFSHITIASPTFQLGETYTIYLDGEKYSDFTIAGIVTTLGSGNKNAPPSGQRR